MNSIAREFWTRMETAEQKLSLVTEDLARKPIRVDGWSRKQILGHLVDSACFNHARFLHAATDGHYAGPSYNQTACVELQGYAQTPWAAILDQWRSRNTWIAETVTNIPEASLAAVCRVGDDAPLTLEQLIRSYLDHLEHHVEQVIRPMAEASASPLL